MAVVFFHVKVNTAIENTASLGAPNRGGIPVAAWQKTLPIFLHGMYQYHVARSQETVVTAAAVAAVAVVVIGLVILQ